MRKFHGAIAAIASILGLMRVWLYLTEHGVRAVPAAVAVIMFGAVIYAGALLILWPFRKRRDDAQGT